MEATLTNQRVQSLDLLKGVILILMALDHTRDFFHESVFIFNPLDHTQTTWPIYITRWITNFCAPAFSFLAGISAFFVGRRKSNGELTWFLISRGLWLIIVQNTLIQFGWYFDPKMQWIELDVIASLGTSMILLGLLVHTPQWFILSFSCLMIFGHNLLDFLDQSDSLWWAILHHGATYDINEHFKFAIFYPLVPWMGVMALGYWIGHRFYDKSVNPMIRKKWLILIGISAIALFLILRGLNIYGNPTPWQVQSTASQTLMHLFNINKYPPSLAYLLITLGPAFLFMAFSENAKGKLVDTLMIFGRVPFFYYIIHLYIIHGLALVAAEFTWTGWQSMILDTWVADSSQLVGFGFPLWAVYILWLVILTILYPICRKFDQYKQNHKEKAWLSYF